MYHSAFFFFCFFFIWNFIFLDGGFSLSLCFSLGVSLSFFFSLFSSLRPSRFKMSDVSSSPLSLFPFVSSSLCFFVERERVRERESERVVTVSVLRSRAHRAVEYPRVFPLLYIYATRAFKECLEFWDARVLPFPSLPFCSSRAPRTNKQTLFARVEHIVIISAFIYI